MISRRNVLKGMCSTAALAMASTLYSGLVLANAMTDKRLVVVILRGGMDGMGALVPYGDPNYEALRQNLALNTDILLRVDSFFGLHRNLETFASMYKSGDLIALPATATPYRERSHFDAQNVLELGSSRPHGLSDGWLNRLVAAINAGSDAALAFGQGMPTIMRGAYPANSWAPSSLPEPNYDYMSLVQKIYAHDKRFSETFEKGIDVQIMGMDALNEEEKKMVKNNQSGQGFVTMAEAAGKWLSKDDGPRIATLELGGWDTHVQQGTDGGRLANNLSFLARGIDALKTNLGSEWSKTVVVAISEFGRTVRPNGTNGTDHGTAGTMFLMGGAVKGGRIIHNWPGLSDADLYEGRDLRPTIDVRSVLKGVLQSHYGLPERVLDNTIYPGSAGVKPMRGLC